MRLGTKIGLYLLVLVCCAGSAKADVVTDVLGCKSDPCIIAYNPGGYIDRFEKAAQAVKKGARKHIMIYGWCASACTLAIDQVSKKVCLTPRARLGFHRGTKHEGRHIEIGLIRYNYIQNSLFDLDYSAKIQQWIDSIGGLPKDGDVVEMPLSVAWTIWQPCKSKIPSVIQPHGLY